jgi:hypothetical protein
MEVHAHTHTPRKKWTHYFWEFLMLFLAVFCGFLAENQREHLIEHKREKKYMETLLVDLIKDTADLKLDSILWDNKIKNIDTIKSELNKKPAERNPVRLYRCVARTGFKKNFFYHDRTINQLKNAGNFRLIRKKNISELLSDYGSYIINEVTPAEADFGDYYLDYLNMQNKLFNSEYFSLLRRQPKQFDSAAAARPDIIAMRNTDETLLFEYYNKLNVLDRHSWYRIIVYRAAMIRATKLIELVKKEYHLK